MLSEHALQRIAIEVAKYPTDQKQSAVMGALRIAQVEQGWCSPEVMQEIAQILEMPAIAVQEVATFYNMYDTKPVGKHKITVCTNLPCVLGGGVRAADYIQQKLKIGFNETTSDGLFTLKEGECMGACGDAPVLLHNNHTMCSHMSSEKIDTLLAELAKMK